MRPKIDSMGFGRIIIAGQKYDRDIIIRLDGQVKKRKKKLSKALYGTSHVISRDEAKHVYQAGAQRLIVGAGHFSMVRLSDEAAGYFRDRNCQVDVMATRAAGEAWNEAGEGTIGLFHVTC